MPDFIPASDAGFDAWVNNFSTKLTAAPTSIGLVAGDATAMAALVTTWNTAYAAVLVPATKTAVTIETKNVARTNAEFAARGYAAIAQAFAGTTNAERLDFGLTVPDAVPTEIGAPTSKPVANIEDNGNLLHVIRLRDELTPTSNAKPDGSIGAEVYVKYGDVAPLSLTGCTYLGLASSRFFQASHDPSQVGEQAHYLTCWINAKGERGPISDGIQATVSTS